MRTATIPTTYLTVEELMQIASAKFEEAASLPEGPRRQEVIKSARAFKALADMKSWLSSELRPPE